MCFNSECPHMEENKDPAGMLCNVDVQNMGKGCFSYLSCAFISALKLHRLPGGPTTLSKMFPGVHVPLANLCKKDRAQSRSLFYVHFIFQYHPRGIFNMGCP